MRGKEQHDETNLPSLSPIGGEGRVRGPWARKSMDSLGYGFSKSMRSYTGKPCR
jgi:hypothetical protein